MDRTIETYRDLVRAGRSAEIADVLEHMLASVTWRDLPDHLDQLIENLRADRPIAQAATQPPGRAG